MRSPSLRVLTLAAHAALLAGLAYVTGFSAGLLLLVPLLLPLHGLWQGRRYTYAWSSMLLTFYCAGLLAEIYMRPAQAPLLRALATVSALEFVSLILFVRARAAETRAAAAAPPSAARKAT
jgi:uncharacterized membrane protein